MRTSLRLLVMVVFSISLCFISGSAQERANEVSDDSQTLYYTANDFYEREKFEDAIQVLTRITTIRPDWALAHNAI